MPNHPVQQWFSLRFRRLLTGAPDGVPPWLDLVAAGDEPGWFEPDEAPWIIHGDLATLVGGIRALLLQALHPGSLAGVRQHSRYREDPLGRLSGTIRWLTLTTFASRSSVLAEAQRVNRMHERIRGSYTAADGSEQSYQAAQPHLLLWVHIAFMDSFLRAHQHFSHRPIPGGADAYIRLWARSVEPLGLTQNIPHNEASLLACLHSYQPELAVTADTREVLEWLRHPPLSRAARTVYALLFQAALASLAPEHRALIGSQGLPLAAVRPPTRAFLRALKLAIGPEAPIEDAARARLQRISAGSH